MKQMDEIIIAIVAGLDVVVYTRTLDSPRLTTNVDWPSEKVLVTFSVYFSLNLNILLKLISGLHDIFPALLQKGVEETIAISFNFCQ